MIKLNIRSRIANKVYIQLTNTANIYTFDDLFQSIFSIPWSRYLPKNAKISIQAVSTNSQLQSLTSIQSVSHKAVLNQLTQYGSEYTISSSKDTIYDLQIYLDNNQLRVFLNTSGAWLHERWYRKHTGDAPLKENIAAAIVLMSGRTRKNHFLDPCCGSGTLCIEAAMIAKNIAPWLKRAFLFQQFVNYNQMLFQTLLQQAIQSIFLQNDYRIEGIDTDPIVLEYAKKNAQLAGVGPNIQFTYKKIQELKDMKWINKEKKTYIVSNPPYGKRLKSDDITEVYETFTTLWTSKDIHVTVISSYQGPHNLVEQHRSQKEIRNGADLCRVSSNKMRFTNDH